MVKVQVNLRIEKSEMFLLTEYAKLTGRTRTDILREMIRLLKGKLKE